MPKVLLLVAFAYLLGSVPSGWLVMKVYRNQDVRKLGSGNIGAANVFRAGGPGAFAATLVADGLKGFIPVMLGILLGLGDQEIALAAIGLAAVLGHTWPIYLGWGFARPRPGRAGDRRPQLVPGRSADPAGLALLVDRRRGRLR